MIVFQNLWITCVFVLLSSGVSLAHTPSNDYNRPNPVMDYVPQEIGMGDHLYTSLGEDDCRSCHGGSVADRHHYSGAALSQGLCTPCHAIKASPPYLETLTDCTAPGCHGPADLGPIDLLSTPPNGWHHYTLFSATDKCTACHDSDFIDFAPVSDYVPFSEYPPSVVPPTTYSCENCHWEQPVIDPNNWDNSDGEPYPIGNEAHPSTYDHNSAGIGYNIYGSATPTIPGDEYHEYGEKIESTFETHHMLFNGNVSTDCSRCHIDPDAWVPTNHEVIRYCEKCHFIESLHTTEPHLGTGIGDPPAVNGWQAAGFHVPDVDNADSTDVAPTQYKSFTANEQCIGCHGDGCLPSIPPPTTDYLLPKVTEISPNMGTRSGDVTLTGTRFGSGVTQDCSVQIKLTAGENWSQASISSWMDTQIVCTLPNTVEIGNYHVMVTTETGNSNVVVFTLVAREENLSISPTSGKCREIITVSGQLTSAQDILDPATGEGTYRAVQVVGPHGIYAATAYGAWSDTEFKFRLGDLFEDTDCNYLRDANEPLLRQCEGLSIGEYLIYVKDIYYQDSDGFNNYTEGDVIEKVETSGPASFTLESGPVVYAVYPRNIERSHYCPDGKLVNGVAKIYGWGFGSTQGTGQVYIGTGPMYTSDTGLALNRVIWGDNLIKVGVDVPPGAMGMTLYLWVEKDSQKTDASYGWPGIQILNSETCP